MSHDASEYDKNDFKSNTGKRYNMDEKREECGVVGIYSKLGQSVTPLLHRALYALQHRGQDAAGFAIYSDKRIIERKGIGLVESIFKKEDLELEGSIGVGHTRYPTIGGCAEGDVQPTVYDGIAVAHNGHIANYPDLKKELEGDGYKFHSTVDSEPMAYYLHRDKEDLKGAIEKIMKNFEGSFSDVAIYHGKLLCYRDQRELRPLVWGENKDFIMVASETVALDVNGIEYKGDIRGGSYFTVEEGNLNKVQIVERLPHHCMFEYVYFSRPDSVINGRSVRLVRSLLGEQLAKESPVKADVVVPVPDTSRTAAMAFAKESSIEYEEGLIKNRYIGRTFIMPTQEKRRNAVKLKLNPVKDIVADKSVVLIDDSIVRGTTMKEIVQLIRDAGAKEVHVRITSPPIKAPCFYGVDIPTFKELIANNKSIEQIKEFIGADSLAYLSLDGLKTAIGIPICDACLTGNYHTEYVKKLAEAVK